MAAEKDVFDEVFGKDPDREAAKKRLEEKAQKKTGAAETAPEQKQDSTQEKTAGTETQPEAENPLRATAAAETGTLSESATAETKEPKKKRPYHKREPKPKPEVRVDEAEQRKAIKKLLLKKAAKAASEKEAEEEDSEEPEEGEDDEMDKEKEQLDETETEKSGSESGSSRTESEQSQDEVHQYLADEVFEEVDDSILKESGIHEEGVEPKTAETTTAAALKQSKLATTLGHVQEVPLKFLEDPKKGLVFIGRKKSVFGKYGEQAALYIGKVDEEGSESHEKKVCLDSLNPHVVFVCGARGSGKSYVLGVIAEELAKKNQNVGTIVVDPVGVFWSMRLPNRDEKEVGLLGQYDLFPEGLTNLKVFVPRGISSQVPKSTYDATFSMMPSLLTVEDWCLTFGMDRFSPTGLLLEKAMVKVKEGYKNIEGKTAPAKKEKYSLDELISCLETDGELNSREKGYKQDSIRALVSRFEAAKSWGIFDEKGTPLSALSKEGQLTVLDTSFLEDTVTALVIGILARRVLAARKVSTRKEAAQRLKTQNMDDLLELEIPPTWLFIDEAHTLIPSGNVKTPATTALVEYVKQGRRPGCSLVFATQQPAAIDTRVLSQLDILIAHKLVFDDDIKAVYKRIPTVIPLKFKVASFIKTLPVGVGLTADRREETSRAFVLKIRPRMSQHEGRDTETISTEESLKPEEVEKLAVEMIFGKLASEGEMDKETLSNALDTLNTKYKAKGKIEKVLEGLKKKGAVIESDSFFLPGAKEIAAVGAVGAVVEAAKAESETMIPLAEMKKGKAKLDKLTEPDGETGAGMELVSFPVRLTAKQAEKVADSRRQKRALGLFGEEELVKSVQLFHEPIYRVQMDVLVKNNTFVSKTIFVSSNSGELVHFVGNHFVESSGVSAAWSLPANVLQLLRLLQNQRKPLKWIAQQTQESEEKTKKIIQELLAQKLLEAFQNKDGTLYSASHSVEIPRDPFHKLMDSLDKVPFEKSEAVAISEKRFSQKELPELVQKLFPNALVKKVEEVYRPFYRVEIEKGRNVRKIRIDAFNGSVY